MDRTVFQPRSTRLALAILWLSFLGQLLWTALPLAPAYFAREPRGNDVVFARDSEYLAPYVPTPQEVVNRMLQLADLKPGDLLYDLGSGDGRIVIAAAQQYGVKAVGFEINPDLVKESRESVRAARLEHLVEIREEDIRTVDFSPASVLTLYLYPAANLRLRAAILRQMKPGSRVVSHDSSMGSWVPDHIEQIIDSTGLRRTLYLWRIAEKR